MYPGRRQDNEMAYRAAKEAQQTGQSNEQVAEKYARYNVTPAAINSIRQILDRDKHTVSGDLGNVEYYYNTESGTKTYRVAGDKPPDGSLQITEESYRSGEAQLTPKDFQRLKQFESKKREYETTYAQRLTTTGRKVGINVKRTSQGFQLETPMQRSSLIEPITGPVSKYDAAKQYYRGEPMPLYGGESYLTPPLKIKSDKQIPSLEGEQIRARQQFISGETMTMLGPQYELFRRQGEINEYLPRSEFELIAKKQEFAALHRDKEFMAVPAFGISALIGGYKVLRHPIKTAQGFESSVTHPLETIKGLASSMAITPITTAGEIAGATAVTTGITTLAKLGIYALSKPQIKLRTGVELRTIKNFQKGTTTYIKDTAFKGVKGFFRKQEILGAGRGVFTVGKKGKYAGALQYKIKFYKGGKLIKSINTCLLYTSPSPRDRQRSRMPSSA